MDEIVDINTLFGPMPFASTDMAVDTLLALMQKHDVGKACVLSTLGVLLDATGGNGATRAATAEHENLLPVATFNPTSFFGDPTPLQNLRADGFCMVRFFPCDQSWPVAFAPFSSLLEALKPTQMPVMVGVNGIGEITALQESLGSYPAPVVLSGVDHSLLAEAIAALRRFDHWHLETSHLLAPGCLSQVVATVGAERLLFGTGAPAYPIAAALHTLRYAGLSDSQRRQVLAANAHRVLSLAG
ncbi:MAG: putative metal-dependent hydrolase of the TIM-barrel fold [Chthonomonadaceae bacterium]|nr:putative metal-dependent hydrolase of the TIM-barrel fold [Chthonomonadaceae bacterium]